MKYILIWWLVANGTATNSVEFNTQQACEVARSALLSEHESRTVTLRAVCVAKGRPQ